VRNFWADTLTTATQTTKLFTTGVCEFSKTLPAPNIDDKSLSDDAVDHRSGVFIV